MRLTTLVLLSMIVCSCMAHELQVPRLEVPHFVKSTLDDVASFFKNPNTNTLLYTFLIQPLWRALSPYLLGMARMEAANQY